MFYVIQENIFREPHFHLLIETLQKYNFGFEVVKYVPFVQEIQFTTERKDVWTWGSPSMVHVATKYNWTPGSMYNSNHDFEVYAEKFGMENMLNGDGQVIKFEDDAPEHLKAFFARPTGDTKLFSGQLFMNYAWNDWKEELKAKGVKVNGDERILVAPLKQTQQEVRCWVVNGKVVTASRYKLGNSVIYQNYDDEKMYIDFAQEMVNKYQPAKAFVIDVCLVDDKLKIVEINCINCSGFYYCNMERLIEAIETHFVL
jgi:hypothetical protein